MVQKRKPKTVNPYVGAGSLTREQFLFYEMRTTAKLVVKGLNKDDIAERIISDNLFQYPTEKSIRNIVAVCLRRLDALCNEAMVQAIADQPSDVAKQICLYAMMKQYPLIWDFMITVIGEKYKQKDTSFGKKELNVFFMRLQEQDDTVASWSDATIKKIKQVITRALIETGYLDNTAADHLNPVLLSSILDKAIRSNHDELALPAFNCFL